jgi:hypothetical protein
MHPTAVSLVEIGARWSMLLTQIVTITSAPLLSRGS